jgi:hypothetical protein
MFDPYGFRAQDYAELPAHEEDDAIDTDTRMRFALESGRLHINAEDE